MSVRIIPARAGFTIHPRGAGSRPADHPRSRGVYTTPATISKALKGSSPLARGLRCARSGCRRISQDHPRSRGVYAQGRAQQRRRPRIIPARAGFTPASLSRTGRSPDHPRSRGVYPSGLVSAHSAPGSSPLARGLPVSWSRDQSALWDHPRSRGVYGARDAPVPASSGSSPLARGLRLLPIVLFNSGWIIPARAGFTATHPGRPRRDVDHPRSRGVYFTARPSSRPEAGSSPLARGLPSPAATAGAPGRIIPARAGFTSSRSCFSFSIRDHPRSRGVYHRPARSAA